MTDPAPARQWPKAWAFLALTALAGFQAFFLLIAMLLCVTTVVALPLLPRLVAIARRIAARERERTGRFLATKIPPPPPVAGDDLAAVLASREARAELKWLLFQGIVGLLVGCVALSSATGVLQNLVIAGFWWIFPETRTTLDVLIASWGDSLYAVATAVGYGVGGLLVVPPLARWFARSSATRLSPSRQSLAERLAEVTETRAAALEAHGTELRRIERNLHDGTQNRLVAVVMHLGMVERAIARDPASALTMVHTAQNAATTALAELREVVRNIYPPVLVDRGLSGAVASLAAHCTIPCTYDERPLARMPAAVEAAAYFVVAEALTNAVKHSGAERITVSLREESGVLVVEITDDGHGGADEAGGSGLVGIRRRVAAFDGTTSIDSPPGGPTVMRVDIPTGL
ncbi:sensor histidine kinase [Umezawaea tangerina]|uniref:histidine kinase n=1 Tax=Umezawaea tangerina TaxID=84725 RepID=A0A2T0TH13_9PSEU|nr:sensor histidine kinase [Umezawaea tangerina]PRY44984.1 signal transduction histidine kinase [Umezawaea tangerina]